MEPQAGMLAGLFERSMGLGPDWRVEDVWFEQPEGAQAELHVRVGRVPGRAVECPSCHARCGVYDTRERTWRHLDIWQYRTVVHCAVPRADCPSCGPRTVRMPWETRPNSHFTALFEAQVLVMKLSGMTTSAVAGAVRESDGRVWRLLSSAVAEARAAADYSGVTRVGVDETACKRGQSYVTTLVDLDARRVVAVTSGRDKASPARLCDELEAHGGDRRRIVEATRDMSLAYSFGIAAAMPNARQTVDRFHVMQLLAVATDRVRRGERGESAEKRALLRGTKYVWLRREGTLSDRQLGVRRDPAREHLMTARACAMTEAVRGAYECPTRDEAAAELDRALSWMMHSNVPEMKVAARSIRAEREGVLNYFSARATNAFLEGLNSVIQSVRRAARGFRNVEYLKAEIFLRLGRLDFPTSPQMVALGATH